MAREPLLEPQVIEWRITGRCNEACLYCYGPDKHIDPPAEVVDEILSKILATNAGFVRFSGGEPLIVSSIVGAITRLAEAGKKVILSTNGLNFSRVRWDIEPCITKLNLSIDGYDPRTHALGGRSMRGFDRAMSVLRGFSDDPPAYQVKIGTVITSRNVAEPDLLPRMYGLLHRLHVDRWKIYQYVPEGPIVDPGLRVEDISFIKLKSAFLNQCIAATGSERQLDIAFSSVESRSAAYFIVEPFGSVFIPVGNSISTSEVKLGNIRHDPLEVLFARWRGYVNAGNHDNNLSINKYMVRTEKYDQDFDPC